MEDNNILLVPASALGRLPRLARLQLGWNRVAALDHDILGAVADRVHHLSLARNVVRELPPDAFQVNTKVVENLILIFLPILLNLERGIMNGHYTIILVYNNIFTNNYSL